ncbi:MAG: sugar-transfer associated ATP-grasp domain-containing protein [Gemmatimonadales bacterium]
MTPSAQRRWARLVEWVAWQKNRLGKTWAAARSARAEPGVTAARMLKDLVRLNARRRPFGVPAYFHYRMFDPSLTPGESARYLPDSPWANAHLWSLLTPERYRTLYDNKLVFNRLFRSFGLPLAEIYAVYDPAVGHTMDGRSLKTTEELREWLRGFGEGGFVLKPVEGISGFRVLVLKGRSEDDPETFVTLAGERYGADRLVQFAANTGELELHCPDVDPRPFLLEERIRPHPELESFIGPTLCTVRVQTIIAIDGSPRIIAAVFKLQPGTSGVDHLVYGAVGCWVDLETGVLGRGRTRTGVQYSSVIPGTDTSFIGFELPQWAAVKEAALRAAAAFPWVRSVGWDVAISHRGPILVEGNARWSPSLIQMAAPRGLMTGDFEVLCDALARTSR